jgi:hypothetical protein
MVRYSCKFVRFKEAAAHVALLEQGHVRFDEQLSSLYRKRAHAFHRDQVAIDHGVRGALGLAREHVRADPRRRNARKSVCAEHGTQMFVDPNEERSQRAFAVHPVVGDHIISGVVKRDTRS